MLVLGAIATVVIRDRDQTRATGRELSVAQEQVSQLTTAYSDEETGTRGFALSGDEGFLEPYNSGTAQATRLSRSLGTTAAHQRALQIPLANVSAAAHQWRTLAAVPSIARRRAGDFQGASTLLTTQGKPLFDHLRATLDDPDHAGHQ